MNVEYLNPFIKSTVNALSTMACLEPSRGNPYLRKTGQKIECDISGTIGVAGEASGSVTVSFSESVARKIVENMLGIQVDSLNDDVKDAVGEIANMIAGGAKGELSEKGYSFKIALPVVCIGKDHYTEYPKDIPCVVIPFSVEEGAFYVEICLKVDDNGK
ncbi:MAG: chemotaxis protein CheX [Candidatus Auribacterota bacterium]|jgi:chemotaxis protein CheX|nr:chemotaxis protein CheX [Candidatus Auribacterota bacterium]